MIENSAHFKQINKYTSHNIKCMKQLWNSLMPSPILVQENLGLISAVNCNENLKRSVSLLVHKFIYENLRKEQMGPDQLILLLDLIEDQ